MRQTKAEREQRAWMRIRRRARARVVQALYAWDTTGREGSLAQAAQRMWDDLALGREEREFAEPLVRRLSESLPAIDATLAEATTNWRLERLGAIERAVLRLGVAELQRESASGRIVIKEALHLAERFGSAESARFVNGVLDAVARSLGRI